MLFCIAGLVGCAGMDAALCMQHTMQAVCSDSDAFLFKPDMLHEFSGKLLLG